MVDEYKKKVDKEIAAHRKTEDALKAAQRKLSDREGQLAAVNQEVRNLEAVIQELRKECQELKEALELAKYGLEQERLLKVDLESKLQSKKAEFVSKKEKHKKEMLEVHSQLLIEESERFKIESEMKARYEGILAQKLEELRKEADKGHNSKYDELQKMYAKIAEELSTVQEEKRTLSMTVENLKSELSQWQSKYEELQQMCANDWEELSNVREENRTLSISIENLKAQIGQWQSKNASLVLRIEDLEKLRAGDLRRADETIAKRDAQIKEMQKIIDSEYEYDEALMGVKSALDLDITAFRKMIEGEEARLNIASLKHIEGMDYSNKAGIQIEEGSADGNFVKLFNSGSKEAVSEVYEEVTIVRTDETGIQGAITTISEDVRMIRRNDATDSRAIMSGLSQTNPDQPVQISQSRPMQTRQTIPIQIRQTRPIQPSQSRPFQTRTFQSNQFRPIQTGQSKPIQTSQARLIHNSQLRPIQTSQSRVIRTSQSRPIHSCQYRPIQANQTMPTQTSQTRPIQTNQSRPVRPAQTSQSRLIQTSQSRPNQIGPSRICS
ncbi:hypothetical protein ACROYT_G000603 [Oculina patagonica]